MSSYSSLLPNDDDDEEVERRSLQKITSSASKPTKKSNYGSLSSNKYEKTIQTTTAFIVNYKHKLVPGETMQGISLKYSVPIEKIKRANRLWSNDLAFIKETLIVPIDREKLKELDFIDMNNVENTSNLVSEAGKVTSTNATVNNGDLHEEKPVDGYKDYLSKFDVLINQSKIKLKSLESNSNLSDYQIKSNSRKSSNHNGFNSAYELEDDADSDDLFKIKNRKNSHKSNNTNNTSIGTNGADNSFDEISHNSSSASSRLNSNLGTSGSQQSSSHPELLITSPNKYTNYYNSNHNLVNTSRARLAQENLQRLEREKDDLYEL